MDKGEEKVERGYPGPMRGNHSTFNLCIYIWCGGML